MRRFRFQSTLPARGATRPAVVLILGCVKFQSTLPARGATNMVRETVSDVAISIHAPRTGSDPVDVLNCFLGSSISIHAPRTGSDGGGTLRVAQRSEFQSTLPARGATLLGRWLVSVSPHFNPRSPHGERRTSAAAKDFNPRFQSTLPARGATEAGDFQAPYFAHFNPRSPHGERRGQACRSQTRREISIHAPRTGSDSSWTKAVTVPDGYFNPRSPHGERPR